MPLTIRKLIDYSGCTPTKKPDLKSRISAGRVLRVVDMKKGIPWTAEEKATLRKLCTTMPVTQVANHFPTRTYGAVSHMVSVLKIERILRGAR